MKKLALLAALLVANVQAATLSVGDGIELLVVDGKEVNESLWSRTTEIELPAGQHQIVLRYDRELKNGSRNSIYTTRPYLFELMMPEQDVRIELPALVAYSQAQAYFQRGPEWTIVLADGSQRTLPFVEMKGDGVAAFSDMEKLVGEYNRQHGITFEQGYAVDLQQAVVEVKQDGQVEISGDALAQLKLWYSKAKPEEKAAFKAWMAKQP
ncbi:DUF2057 domain-containing protein [Photobacterium galatheae]|uniref:Uncharacterized protein n=1 Tax=Photobacterium galatheae TaxID=1654360 RepID=A0A066RS08_9GAMM|nr:DUF2057 domain-containing protein [Photobacterium galatheae]KDM93200.1 hypothetical protein EA58_03140 [Photobacterium galatheae]MCM0148271.1 DUF2057 domain-containing protein [Photobacterium galatheae]